MSVKNILLKLIGGDVILNGSWGFRIPSLPNEDTIGTDANGELVRGKPKITVSTTAPSSPVDNDLWVDTN